MRPARAADTYLKKLSMQLRHSQLFVVFTLLMVATQSCVAFRYVPYKPLHQRTILRHHRGKQSEKENKHQDPSYSQPYLTGNDYSEDSDETKPGKNGFTVADLLSSAGIFFLGLFTGLVIGACCFCGCRGFCTDDMDSDDEHYFREQKRKCLHVLRGSCFGFLCFEEPWKVFRSQNSDASDDETPLRTRRITQEQSAPITDEESQEEPRKRLPDTNPIKCMRGLVDIVMGCCGCGCDEEDSSDESDTGVLIRAGGKCLNNDYTGCLITLLKAVLRDCFWRIVEVIYDIIARCISRQKTGKRSTGRDDASHGRNDATQNTSTAVESTNCAIVTNEANADAPRNSEENSARDSTSIKVQFAIPATSDNHEDSQDNRSDRCTSIGVQFIIPATSSALRDDENDNNGETCFTDRNAETSGENVTLENKQVSANALPLPAL